MKALLWREWRWNRGIFIAGVVIFFLPYVIAIVIMLWPRDEPSPRDIAGEFYIPAIGSFVISQLTLTLLGGNAIAGERSDRTAEFLAYLPISKRQRLVAKLIFMALIAALAWGLNWLAICSLRPLARAEDLFWLATYVALFSFAAFGTAWFVSSLQSSPTYAVCAGITAAVMLLLTPLMIDLSSGIEPGVWDQLIKIGFPVVSLALGSLGFVAGSWYFLKRIEP